MCSFVCAVSKIPGVSTITIFRPNLIDDLCEHLLVIDEPEAEDSNNLFPRIVFPVALFPVPVFPRRTILISSCPTMKWITFQNYACDYIMF